MASLSILLCGHDQTRVAIKEEMMMHDLLSAWWVWAVPLAFVAVLFYAFNPKRKKQFEEEARVPLEDDPPVK
jgi:cbb3-type cytochrome oxidase subunit 3